MDPRRSDDKDHDCLCYELAASRAIDVGEAFIDASFAPAKKGDPRSERQNVEREQRSWQSQIATDCQFLFASKVPRRTK
jgi:hypothetical protein